MFVVVDVVIIALAVVVAIAAAVNVVDHNIAGVVQNVVKHGLFESWHINCHCLLLYCCCCVVAVVAAVAAVDVGDVLIGSGGAGFVIDLGRLGCLLCDVIVVAFAVIARGCDSNMK